MPSYVKQVAFCAVRSFVSRNIQLRVSVLDSKQKKGFFRTRVLQTHFEMGIQAAGFLASSLAIKTKTDRARLQLCS